MTDRTLLQDRTTAGQTDLAFPTLPSTKSISALLSHSYTVIMATSSTPDDRPPSSLSDSWASLSGPDFTSEDDTRSESTDNPSLVGQPSSDDVSELTDTESNSEAEARDADRDVADSQEISPASFPAQTSLHSLDSTIMPGGADRPIPIQFEEPERWPDAEQVELKHTVHIFDEDEVAEVVAHSSPELLGAQLLATVRMTMTREDLRLTRPFRILYLGGHQDIKSSILTKIGDALVANAGFGNRPTLDSSMYHILQTSFHPGASPTELVPIDAQLIVDDCVGATSQKTGFRQADQITLTLKKGQSWSSVWHDTSYAVKASSQWTPPDIAVFFIPQQESIPERQSRTYAHVFMNRHNIPTMMISEGFLWRGYKGVMPFDHKSLHGCVEVRTSSRSSSHVLKRLPIDLATFQSIAPGQLSRNLACLTGLYVQKSKSTQMSPSNDDTDSRNLKSFSDIEKHPLTKSMYPQRTPWSQLLKRSPMWGIAAVLGIAVLCQFLLTVGHLYSRRSPAGSIKSPTTPPHKDQGAATMYSSSTTTTATVYIPDTTLPPKSLATVDPKRELQKLLTPEMEAANKSDNFQVYVIGDCHMIIKPPQYFMSKKKIPAFHVKISRGNQVLSHNLSKLFDGIFTTQLDREEAYGPINVTISTMKPVLTQVTEIDFGTPWLKIAGWKKAAQMVSEQLQSDVENAQKEVAVYYQRISTELQVRIQSVSKAARLRATKDQELLQAKSKAFVEAAKVQSVALSERVTQEMTVASSYVAKQVECANRGVAVFVKHAWQTAYRKGVELHEASSKAEFGKTLQEARKSKILAKAQDRVALLLVNPSEDTKDDKPEIPPLRTKKPHRKGKHNR